MIRKYSLSYSRDEALHKSEGMSVNKRKYLLSTSVVKVMVLPSLWVSDFYSSAFFYLLGPVGMQRYGQIWLLLSKPSI